MPADPDSYEVRAAGGVVWRRAAGGVFELGLIHRPQYDDWSLPKGKLDRGETWEDAALREVEEEIGVRCELGDEVAPVTYRDRHGREKLVRYWLMEAADNGSPFEANDEVDEVRWLTAGEALALLTYERDRDVVAEAIEALR